MIDWSNILAKHGPAVWRTVYRLLNQHADALDCYQETFLTAWQLSQRETVDDWPSLLTSMATRRAMDRLRQLYRQRPLSLAIDRIAEPFTDRHSPPGEARATELMEQLRQAMAELPDKHAEVFWLSSLEGWSHQQISERMQITSGEVRVLLHRARTRLEALLGVNPLYERT